MTTLIDTVNKTREDTLNKHYDAAVAELNDKITSHPLKTYFHVYSGCVSKDITQELAHRFNSQSIKASHKTYGLFGTHHCLHIEISLPDSLVHVKPEEKSEEVPKTEDQPIVEVTHTVSES